MEQHKNLIEILIDANASEADKDDAAIDLALFDEEEVEFVLIATSNDLATSELVRGSCGESLAEIWIRKGTLNINKMLSLRGIALIEALAIVKSKKPSYFEECLLPTSAVATENKTVIIKLSWLSKEDARQFPPSGPICSSVAKFEDVKDKWPNEAWNIIAEFTNNEGHYDVLANMRLLAKEAPHQLLYIGSKFELFEGMRKIADGEVLCEDTGHIV